MFNFNTIKNQQRLFPSGLCAFTTLYWGWVSSWMIMAIIIAFAIELAPFYKKRFDFSKDTVGKLFDFFVIATVVLAYVIFLQSEKNKDVLLPLVHWVPILFLPLAICSQLATNPLLPWQSLFILLRKESPDKPSYPSKLHPLWLFIFIEIISSSFFISHAFLFFFFNALCVLWIAWFFKIKIKKRYGATLCIIISFILAYEGQKLLKITHNLIQKQTQEWITQYYSGTGFNLKDTSAIGEVLNIQLNDNIYMRIKSEKPLTLPFRMRESIYNYWNGQNLWIGLSDNDIKTFNNTKLSKNKLDVSFYLQKSGNVPHPYGLSKISFKDGTIIDLTKDDLGTLSMEAEVPFLQSVQMSFRPKNSHSQHPPISSDLHIPENQQKILSQFLNLEEHQQLDKKNIGMCIATLKNTFSNYEYSLEQKDFPADKDPLHVFLFDRKSGHCEYYATAMALLLRSLKIPSRYITGYQISEYSNWDNQYIARGRDRHAWVEAWDGRQWVVVDATPAGISSTPWSRPFRNGWEWIKYKFESWRWQGNKDNLKEKSPYLIILVLLYVLYRNFMPKKKNKKINSETDHLGSAYNIQSGPVKNKLDALEKALCHHPSWQYCERNNTSYRQWFSQLEERSQSELEKYVSKSLPLLLNELEQYLYHPKSNLDSDEGIIKSLDSHMHTWSSQQKE